MNNVENFLVTFSIVSACFLAAVCIPKISDAMTVIGDTSNPAVGFCLPIMFWLKNDKSSRFSFKRLMAHLTNIIVICVAVYSLYLFFS